MTFFNGRQHGWNGPNGYVAGRPTMRIYCDYCAAAAIPLPAYGPDGRTGSRHWGTDFSWVGYYGGEAICDCCLAPADSLWLRHWFDRATENYWVDRLLTKPEAMSN